VTGTRPTLFAIRVAFVVLPLFALFTEAQEPAPVSPTSLQSGSTIRHDISGTAVDAYSIALAAGECAQIDVEQRGIDVVVEVVDMQKKVLAAFDAESRTQGHEQVPFISDNAETYEIRVRPTYSRAPGGEYEIRIVEIREANNRDRELFKAHRLSTEAAALRVAGKYDDATARMEEAIAAATNAVGANDAYVGALTASTADLLWTKGDLPKAKASAERAAEIARQLPEPNDPQLAAALDVSAQVYRSSDEGAKAEELLKQVIEITQRSLGDDHPKLVQYRMQLAWQYGNRGDFAGDMRELQHAAAIADKSLEPDDFWSIAVKNNLGDLYLNQEDLDHAEPLAEQALTGLEKKYGPENPRVAIPLQNLGAIARQRRQYARALELLERAEKINEKALGGQHPRTAALLINIGNVHKDEGQYDQAEEFFKRALDILEVSAGPYNRLTLQALTSLSTVSAAEGKRTQALAYSERATQAAEENIGLNLATGSERDKLEYADTIDDLNDRVISFSLQQDPNNKEAASLAATVVLRRKSRILDSIAKSRADLQGHLRPEDAKLLDDLDAATNKLARAALSGPGKTPPGEYSKQLTSLQQERETIEVAVSRRSAGFYEGSHAITLAEIQAVVPANAALVEFVSYRPFDPKARDVRNERYGDRRYAAFVISHQGDLYAKDLGDAKEINKMLDGLRRSLRDPQRSDAKEVARAAYAEILEPIAGSFGSATHLILSPDGELQLIPFDALIDTKGRYVVERYTTTYVTTGRDLLRLQLERPSKNKPLIVANPFFGAPGSEDVAQAKANAAGSTGAGGVGDARRSVTVGEDLSAIYFAPLAGTALEARSIKGLFPDTTVLSGKEVTEAAIKRVEAPSILHIATHGFFLEDSRGAAGDPAHSAKSLWNMAPENPLLRSGLALSGANEHKTGDENGILTALQASGLNLWGTKLVTLSACDTGIGEVKDGEGVYGLRRAFFLAGTQSLVMSLWPVSDSVTREMMVDYYTGLKRGLGRGEALRQAELAMLKRKGRQHPFYWASFIESGEWANLGGKR
jgi:CHAT domain-containing protein/Tfp pilus assembly protein PilF